MAKRKSNSFPVQPPVGWPCYMLGLSSFLCKVKVSEGSSPLTFTSDDLWAVVRATSSESQTSRAHSSIGQIFNEHMLSAGHIFRYLELYKTMRQACLHCHGVSSQWEGTVQKYTKDQDNFPALKSTVIELTPSLRTWHLSWDSMRSQAPKEKSVPTEERKFLEKCGTSLVSLLRKARYSTALFFFIFFCELDIWDVIIAFHLLGGCEY